MRLRKHLILIGMFRFDQNRTERKTRSRSWFELSHCGLQADYNVAYLHYLQGDYHRAIELYAATRIFCAGVGDPYPAALCDPANI